MQIQTNRSPHLSRSTPCFSARWAPARQTFAISSTRARSLALTERGFEITSLDAPDERVSVPFCWCDGHKDVAAAVARMAREMRTVISARNGVMRVSQHFPNTADHARRLLDNLDQVAQRK